MLNDLLTARGKIIITIDANNDLAARKTAMVLIGRRHLVRFVVRLFLLAVVLVTTAIPVRLSASPIARSVVLPERPRVFLDTTYTPPTGPTLTIPADGNFQAALNSAQPGSVIILQAGATYVGPFTLPPKAGTGWIYVQSSALRSLPPPGTRVTPTSAALMPKIVGNGALVAGSTAHHYRFSGIEFRPPAGVFVTSLLDVGGTHIVIDRCYIHGDPAVGGHRGIALNGGSLAVIDSYFSDWKWTANDAQAIQGWYGPGPYKIVNNYLEASAENVIFGGGDPSTAGLVPSDIEIRGNHFFKPLSWRVGDPSYAGTNWVVKNLFELKNARRVLVDGNIFENNWYGNANTQDGLAIVFTPRNQDGTAPWSAVQDVTFTHNIVRRSTGGFYILGWDNFQPSQQLRRLLIQDNLLVDIGAFPSGLADSGVLFLMADGPSDVVTDHNTAIQAGHPIGVITQVEGRWPATGFVFTNNITRSNEGVSGEDTLGNAVLTLRTYFPGARFARNLLVGGSAGNYPPDNFLPVSLSLVGFMNLDGRDYRLRASSPYKHAGTDGRDLGADFNALAVVVPSWWQTVTRP